MMDEYCPVADCVLENNHDGPCNYQYGYRCSNCGEWGVNMLGMPHVKNVGDGVYTYTCEGKEKEMHPTCCVKGCHDEEAHLINLRAWLGSLIGETEVTVGLCSMHRDRLLDTALKSFSLEVNGAR